MFSSATISNSIDWNGLYWIATSNGITNFASSTNGISWSQISTTFSMSNCLSILWTGKLWLCGGITASNSGTIAYSYNNGITWNSVISSPFSYSVSGFATNNKIIVSIGATSSASTGNTLAYSYDGINWTGLGTSIFNNTTNLNANIKWLGNSFISFSSDSSFLNKIANSIDGINWISSTTSSSVFTTAAYSGDCTTLNMPHSIVFPTNSIISGNLVSRDNGLTWTTISNNISPNSSIEWNGIEYLFGSSYNSSYSLFDLSGALIQSSFFSSFGTDISSVNVIKWNGNQWFIGTTSQSTNQVLFSYDGFNWQKNVASYFSSPNYSCNGISWNGNIWVISGVSSTTSFLLYSSDGYTWAQSSTLGGGVVEWNGAYFICSGPNSSSSITNLSISNNGVLWNQINIGSYGNIKNISWNGNIWVITTPTNILNSYDGVIWNNAMTGNFSGVQWNGTSFVVSTLNTSFLYSYNGFNWNTTNISPLVSGKNILWNKPNIGTLQILQPTIVGGNGNYHTMAYSDDGVKFIGLSNCIFSNYCSHICWNGNIWVAGGSGFNTLAYSYNGIQWTGLGNSIFSSSVNHISWNNSVFLACGSGGNTLATSTNGKIWNAVSSPFDISGLSADWNGYMWMAAGQGTANTIAYSSLPDASIWYGLGKTTFSTLCNSIYFMSNKWVAGGSGGNTLAYSYNGINNWFSCTSSPFSISANTIYWNGQIAISGGTDSTNTIATSLDGGITWSGIGNSVFSISCNGVFWNTKRWIAVGNGGNTIAYSYNGINWYNSASSGSFLNYGLGVASNSKIGAAIVPSGVFLNSNDRILVNSPKIYDSGITNTSISLNLNLPT
jgi:hypothetical protein